jgi:hypothetical protein
MPRTVRVYWHRQQSGWLNFNWNNAIFPNSVVHISACEGGGVNEGIISGALDAMSTHRGDAVIGVRNVRAHGTPDGTGGVEFFLEVFWGEPLDVVTDITVFDPPEQGVIV